MRSAPLPAASLKRGYSAVARRSPRNRRASTSEAASKGGIEQPPCGRAPREARELGAGRRSVRRVGFMMLACGPFKFRFLSVRRNDAGCSFVVVPPSHRTVVTLGVTRVTPWRPVLQLQHRDRCCQESRLVRAPAWPGIVGGAVSVPVLAGNVDPFRIGVHYLVAARAHALDATEVEIDGTLPCAPFIAA